MIDFDILLEYQVRELGLHDTLALADFPADQYALHCAYSKKMKVSAETMNLVIVDLIQSGKVERILQRYR